NRIEQLANNFASALLMPARLVERFGNWAALAGGALAAQLKSVADAFQVTASALKWRLVALGKLKLAAARALADQLLRQAAPKKSNLPPLFSRMFMDVVARALEDGRISARRAAGVLDMTGDELSKVFEAHAITSPVGLRRTMARYKGPVLSRPNSTLS